MESSRRVSRRQRSARSSLGTKVDLQFVYVTPDDRDRRTETRTIVRANAAHFHWRHNRPPQDKSNIKKAVQPATSSDDEVTSRSLMPMKSTQLGIDVDPFSSYNCDLPRAVVNNCIAFNAQVILPALFPDNANNFNIRASMIQLSTSNPYVLHMFMTGALVNSHGTLRAAPSSRIALYMFRTRASIIRHMSIAMKDPIEACKDINIFAVVALAKTGTFHGVGEPLKTPKQGPLRSLQLLDLLALSEIDPIHFDGLSKLIGLKGGLENIEMPGLAALISLGGLLAGSRNCTAPRFPVVTLSCPTREFIFQGQGLGFGADQDLYMALSKLNSYTAMIDNFCEGRNVVAASVLIDHRNSTQHALLSLPLLVGRPECYRLAALIYSLLVTFPLPYNAAPFKCLVTRLKIALSEWDGDDRMLIWVITMGGVGATGLDDREWFVHKFRMVVERIGVRSWVEAKDIIKKGLWYEATNDRDGQDLWLESRIAD